MSDQETTPDMTEMTEMTDLTDLTDLTETADATDAPAESVDAIDDLTAADIADPVEDAIEAPPDGAVEDAVGAPGDTPDTPDTPDVSFDLTTTGATEADLEGIEAAAAADVEGVEGVAGAAAGEAAEGEDADDPWTRPGAWYVVHTQSGYEKKVTANLQARIQSMNMEDKIYEVVIPMEEVVEFKGGRRQTVQRKVFPGYLLVRCVMDDESWYCIRNTPGVTGFVGQSRQGQKPTPLGRRDVRNFLAAKGDGGEQAARPKPKLEFDVGESVRVREGPFADFSGEIAEINADHLKLKVLVNIFGRETLVEMDFSQVAKL